MICLKQLDGLCTKEILRLRVGKDQENFVADNAASLAEAKTAAAGGGQAFPFGIYADDTAVGFLMIVYGTDENWENPPDIAKGNYSLWRLMIGEEYQRRGYGKAAVELALAWIRTLPCGKAEFCWLSCHPANSAAIGLYRALGFRQTGEKDGVESIYAVKL